VQRRLRASASGVAALLPLTIARAICLCSALFLAVVLSVRCAPASVCLSVHLSAVMRPRQGPRQARASHPGRAEVVPELDDLGPDHNWNRPPRSTCKPAAHCDLYTYRCSSGGPLKLLVINKC
jgi:hypothetical protein